MGPGARRSRAGLSAIATALLCLALMPALAFAASEPVISNTSAGGVSETAALLKASINPGSRPTTSHFEYADQASFEAEGFTGAKSTAPEPIGGGSTDVPVSAPVAGLSPGTTYHYRAVAVNTLSPAGGTLGPARTFKTLVGPQGGLPDARAYEQSTPLDKNGGDVTGPVTFVKAAFGGGGITYASSTGVPGGTGAQELTVYAAERSEGEWSSRGLLPPASSGQLAEVIGWTPDLSSAFASATELGEPRKTALLELGKESPPAEVAPYVHQTDPLAFAGTSADQSEVFFEEKAALPGVAGATEGKPNLYVWDKTSKQVSLAGILNEGDAPSQGAFAAPYDWVNGTSATTLGRGGADRGYYTQESHAVTAGGAVYFTAARTGQLYLRLNPAKAQVPPDGDGECTPQPELACTVHISASQRSSEDPVGPAPAAFMAASENGQRAFFTSSQKLTDDATTGPEQGAPAIGRALPGGNHEPIEPGFLPARAVGVAVNGSYVYWADPLTGTIGRAEIGNPASIEPSFIAPGPVEFEIAPGVFESVPSKPRYVAVEGEYVYWTNTGRLAENGEPLDEGGTIGRAKLGPTEAEEVKPAFIKGASNPQGIAVNPANVYWANAGGSNLTQAIARAELNGSNPKQRFCDGFFLPPGTRPRGLALSPARIYFASNDNNDFGSVTSVKLACEEETFGEQLPIGQGSAVRGVAVDASHVYWAAQNEGAIGSANLDFSEPHLKAIEVQGKLNGVAADGSHIYWSVNGEPVPNAGNDLYLYDSAKAGTSVLSDLTVDGGDPPAGAAVQGLLGASEDGSSAYFAANGDLDGAGPATPGNCKGTVSSASGSCNLYLWREGAPLTFVARLDASKGDALNWMATPIGVFADQQRTQKTARVSPDGHTLLFRSASQLTEYENKGVPELYRYREGNPGSIACVSCNPAGTAPTAAPTLASIVPSFLHPAGIASVGSRNLSSSGDQVFFETAEALVGADTNGDGDAGCKAVGSLHQAFPACQDVYEWEAAGSPSCPAAQAGGGCLFLLSTGKSTYPSFFADASASGKDAFIFTRSQLVGQDKDELLDVYDARVNGGLPGQNPPPASNCEGVEACHGPPPPPPVSSSPGTESFSGPGNQKPKHVRPKKKKHRHKHGGHGHGGKKRAHAGPSA
jgi:hypothetical protein